jgi:hypothetical protein
MNCVKLARVVHRSVSGTHSTQRHILECHKLHLLSKVLHLRFWDFPLTMNCVVAEQLFPFSRVLLEKLIVAYLVKHFTTFYRIHWLITVFTKFRH